MIPESAEVLTTSTEEIMGDVRHRPLWHSLQKPHYAMGMVMTIAVGDVSDA
jgi:hypothetical protein